ncbi:MAG TPA: hypothetical protein VN922_03785 [Bacteroidia bacterium]|nr:hypothetical protein [Bacteroidia bacterium]
MRNFLLIPLILFVVGCKNINKRMSVHARRDMQAHPGWDSLGSGIKGCVNALAIYKDNLYVGGRIDSAGGKRMHGIAMWDGQNWYSVGKGISGNVNSLVVYNGELYVGGFFDSAGGKPFNCIARWNGTEWSDVDTLEDIIAMTTYNNRLYATGFNDTTDEKTTHTIGAWDGKEWDTLNNPDKNWEIRSLCAYKGLLYGGGRIYEDTNLIVFKRRMWSFVNRAFKFDINAMLEYNDELYVAGGDASGNTDPHIYKWNGTLWSKPGAGLKGEIKSLAVYSNKLYAGGQFARVNKQFAGCLACWDGNTWNAIDGGVNLNNVVLEKICPVTDGNLVVYVDTTPNTRGVVYYDTLFANLTVNAMLEYKGQLYIAGKFDFAGGVAAQNIARYKEPARLNQ